MLRRLALNVASNWANAVVAALLAFVVTPYVIEGLKDPVSGNKTYGVWVFIVSLSAYFGLLDLGFFQGVIQFFTRYRTQGRRRDYNRVVSTAVAALTLVAAAATLIALGAAWRFPTLIDTGGLTAREAQVAFFLSAFAVIVRLPLQMFAAVIVGCNRFHVLNALAIAGRLVAAAGVLWALALGTGLVGVAAATTLGALVGLVGQAWAAFRLEPGLRLRANLLDWSTLRDTMSYGKWMLGGRLYDLYLANVDLIIVPLLFGSEAIAVYGVAVSLATHAQVGVQGYTFALTPSAIAADAKQSLSEMRSVMVRSTRIGLILAGGIVLGAVFWGETFLYQWLQDPSFLWEAEYVSAATVLTIVALDRILLQGLAGPQQVLIGMRRVRELCFVKIGQGVAAVVLAYALGSYFGILAIPWALLASSLGGRVVLTGLACRLTGLPVGRFLSEAVLPAASTLAATGGVAWVLTRVSTLSGWIGLAVEGFLFVLGGAIVAVAVGLTRSERSALLRAMRPWIARR